MLSKKARFKMLKKQLFDIYNIEDSIEIIESDGVLIFGDSQIQGTLGKKLSAKFGGVREFRAGSTACDWNGSLFSKISDELNKKPKNIIIALGGNGSGCVKDLLESIYKITPNSNITFFTPPPPARRGSMDKGQLERHKAVFTSELTKNKYKKYLEGREKKTENVISQINSSSFQNKSNIINSYDELNKGYDCIPGDKLCDGIHLRPKEADILVSAIV